MSLARDAVFWNAFKSHAELTVQAAKLLEEMLEKPSDAPSFASRISELENNGDKITHDTVHALHQTWITPLDREEIHSLIGKLDDVLDFVESAAERISLYEITEAMPEARELAAVLSKSAVEVAKAVAALTDIQDGKVLLEHCKAINEHEGTADGIFRRGLARLFKEVRDPLTVMKWRDIYESLETATDRAEDVANIIEGIVLEHA